MVTYDITRFIVLLGWFCIKFIQEIRGLEKLKRFRILEKKCSPEAFSISLANIFYIYTKSMRVTDFHQKYFCNSIIILYPRWQQRRV